MSTDGRTDGRTDGHGETSISPYNFVAGGIKMQTGDKNNNIRGSPEHVIGHLVFNLISKFCRKNSVNSFFFCHLMKLILIVMSTIIGWRMKGRGVRYEILKVS